MPARPIPKILAISALVTAALGMTFVMLPLRAQGLIVEYVTFADWPLEWALKKQFRDKQPELAAIQDFVADSRDVEGLMIAPGGLRVSLQSSPSQKYDLDNPKILQAMQSIETHWVSIRDGRSNVFMGIEDRSGLSIEASYVERGAGHIEIPFCETIDRDQRDGFGVCAVQLDDRWYIQYRWSPADSEEFDELLRQKQKQESGS